MHFFVLSIALCDSHVIFLKKALAGHIKSSNLVSFSYAIIEALLYIVFCWVIALIILDVDGLMTIAYRFVGLDGCPYVT